MSDIYDLSGLALGLDVERCLRLAVRASEWGGELHVLPKSRWPGGLETASFDMPCALNWASCSVYVDCPEAWPYAIHEMAHCFAMDKPPAECGPTEPVGWQFLLACHLDVHAGRDWLSFFRLRGYNVGKDFRHMTVEELQFYMAWTVGFDRDRGLLDGIAPTAIRKGPPRPLALPV